MVTFNDYHINTNSTIIADLEAPTDKRKFYVVSHGTKDTKSDNQYIFTKLDSKIAEYMCTICALICHRHTQNHHRLP